MESYPGELLVGVFPLVFCVDATLSRSKPGAETTTNDGSGSGSGSPTNANANAKTSSARSQFDRFLDAMAASLLEEPERGERLFDRRGGSSSKRRSTMDDAMMSLFQVDDSMGSMGNSDEQQYQQQLMDSDAEDDMIFQQFQMGAAAAAAAAGNNGSSSTTTNNNNNNNNNADYDGGDNRRTSRNNFPAMGFSRLGSRDGSLTGFSPIHKKDTVAAAAAAAAASGTTSVVDTSFAKILQEGQGFFQRARIISISSRHGFPPSKDPTGEDNRLRDFFLGKTMHATKMKQAIQRRPIDGIIPSGWLGKHAAALPSVILVVVQVCSHTYQYEQDALLQDTMTNLQLSLATKRGCTIRVVGLVQEGISTSLATEWSQNMATTLTGKAPAITLLDVAAILQDAEPSPTLQGLHQTVHDASLRYYITQGRRTKRKLFQLLGSTSNNAAAAAAATTPLLWPLCIRYCFKVAMFYEFQWNPEKSLKYMVEAYRHVETYYRYLLQQQQQQQQQRSTNTNTNSSGGQAMSSQNDVTSSGPQIRLSHQTNIPTMGSGEEAGAGAGAEGVEMSLQSSNTMVVDSEMNQLLLHPPTIPDDMVHQCRVLADWLNFKILQSALTSHTEGGLLLASRQWQRHTLAFLSPRTSFIYSTIPTNQQQQQQQQQQAFVDWAFVAHQRLVASQLLERYPPKVSMMDLCQDEALEDLLLRCSPWRNYEAAAEAWLQLGVQVRKAASVAAATDTATTGSIAATTTPEEDDMRSRYVGGLDKEGVRPSLQEELQVNHRERALDYIKRAMSLYDREVQKMAQEDFKPWSQSAAHMNYLAGGTLLGLDRHAEAIPYLEKAATLTQGWNGLELAVRRLLIECYEKHIPEEASEESSQALASMLLDSYFHADMSNADLRQALEKFSKVSGAGNTIRWYRDYVDEADDSLPFSFALTFPGRTHATAGDSVEASVLIKSNLDYAVHVNSVSLHTFTGKILIPSADLLSAVNANEGKDGGIIVQARSEIWLSTHVKLPKDLDKIKKDETGNGGENEGVAGKGSFSKAARPRTGGITSAAGARMVSEQEFEGKNQSDSANGQWSLKCLGGKPLRCDGICLIFYPVHSAAMSGGKKTEIELTIEKKHDRTEANIKRTPFEEENYISSSWMRPRHLSMHRGPRCLRVLPPMADMNITNLTRPCTNGKVLEGTVNRILLRLQAGPQENCTNVAYSLSCASLLMSSEGVTTKITSEPAEEGAEGSVVDSKSVDVRMPVLVTQDENATSQITKYGYEIPAGWSLAGGNGRGATATFIPIIETLKSGDSTYAIFDVFRPSPQTTRISGVVGIGEDESDLEHEHSMCQTDIDVVVRYSQDRPAGKAKQMTTKRRGRRKSSEESESASTSEGNQSDVVFLTRSFSVIWSAPISANFSPGLKQTQPSGNRHPSNTVPDATNRRSPVDTSQTELVLVDGERVSTKCILKAVASADGLMADLEEIRFNDANDENSPCTFELLSGKDVHGLVYKAEADDPCRKLVQGSQFSLAWMSQVRMKSNYLKGSVSASLGVLSIDWVPCAIELPTEVKDSNFSDSLSMHGPLRLSLPSTCRFVGPPCYIENAPFVTTMDRLPDALQVLTPFTLTYHIKNKTSLDQTLKVSLKETEHGNDESPPDVLVAGRTNGAIALGPFEMHTLTYTVIPTRSGQIDVPNVCVSSDRYNTWLIQESNATKRTIFVLP